MPALAPDRSYIRAVGDEPLPGYRLITPLGMGGFGEVWKCLAPGGLHKAIKFVHEANEDTPPSEPSSLRQEQEAFERIKGIRHPFLLTLERVEIAGGELIMVMELADQSLGNRYDECRAAGLPGIPRDELLSYMVDAAEALDVLGRQHGLQHLDVKPANLFLVGGHVKVGDYGLVARHRASLEGEEARLGRGLTPKYVAPEILCDRVDPRSDQYPLALVYMELLTGVFPYSGKSARQLILQHASAEPDVSALPASDRETVRKALAKDPAGRFSTCLSFVKSLLHGEASAPTQSITNTLRSTPPGGTPTPFPVALVTPVVRRTGTSPVESTIRLNANPESDAALPSYQSEFERQHPGWKYLCDGRPSPRGRVVRVADAKGDAYQVQLLKLPAAQSDECEAVIGALASLPPRVPQIAIRPNSFVLSIAVPEKFAALKDHWANRKAPDERPAIQGAFAGIAVALDAWHRLGGMGHGLLSPATILQTGATWQPTLFGAGEILQRSRGDSEWRGSDPYAAPEALLGRAIPASDQYALALIFLEWHNAWNPAERRTRPDRTAPAPKYRTESLLEQEIRAVKRALSIRPDQRFDSCAAFVAALAPPPVTGVALDEVRVVECAARLAGRPANAQLPPLPQKLTDALLLESGAEAVVAWPSTQTPSLIVRLPDGRWSSRFPVKLTPELALLKLQAFQTQHSLELAQFTADSYALKPKRSGGMELVVQLPRNSGAGPGEIHVSTRSLKGEKADQPAIAWIEQFRRSMQNTNERRHAARFRCELPILAYPISDQLGVGAALAGICTDVSATGFAGQLQGGPTSDHVFVTFPEIPAFRPWSLLAKVVRSKPGPSGTSTIAGRFVHAGV